MYDLVDILYVKNLDYSVSRLDSDKERFHDFGLRRPCPPY